jgi:hypothetical protein
MSKIYKKRVLPLDGNVLVKEKNEVEPDTIIAEMTHLGERPFIVNIAGRLQIGFNEIGDYLTKKIGDFIEVREVIAKRKKMAVNLEVQSPVSGFLEFISPASGNVVIREKVKEEEIGPVTVNCSETLNIKSENLKPYLNKKIGDIIEKSGEIASKPVFAGLGMEHCRSPIYGKIISIDLEKGTVTIKRPIEERRIDAYIKGVVKEIVPNRGAVIETEGESINGVFGFGGERYGILGEDIIILENYLKRDEFDDYKGNVKGIITPSINSYEFKDLFDEEISKGITKENNLGTTIILMSGFGDKKIDEILLKKLNEFTGRQVSIDGRTQIRAGARRPEIIIPL